MVSSLRKGNNRTTYNEEMEMCRRLSLLVWILLLILPITGCQQEQPLSSEPLPAGEPCLFEGGGFSFLYPSSWQTMTEDDIDKLWETELRGEISGFSQQDIIWQSGVFVGHVDPSNHPDSANIFVLTARVAGLPGPMPEADFDNAFNNVKASFESGLGDRLLSIQKRMIGELQVIEVEGLGESRRQVLRSIFIFAKADHLYYISCGVNEGSRDSFKPVFDEAIASLKVSPGE